MLKRQPSCRRLAHLTWIAAQPDRDRAGSSILPHAHRPCRSFIKDGPQEGCDSTSVRLRAISGPDSSGNYGPGTVISCVSLCDAHRVQTRDVQGRVQCRRRAVWLPGTDSGSRRAPEGSAASSSSAWRHQPREGGEAGWISTPCRSALPIDHCEPAAPQVLGNGRLAARSAHTRYRASRRSPRRGSGLKSRAGRPAQPLR